MCGRVRMLRYEINHAFSFNSSKLFFLFLRPIALIATRSHANEGRQRERGGKCVKKNERFLSFFLSFFPFANLLENCNKRRRRRRLLLWQMSPMELI